MKSLLHDEAFQHWKTYWDEASHEFFKVEAVQDYSGEELIQSPSYEAWHRGDKKQSIELMEKSAPQWSKQTQEKPILKRRVHIVEEPYCDYLEWEIMHYKLVNIPLGDEQVFLVNKDDLGGAIIPGDFMIFDDERVANSHYDNTGKMIGMDFYDRDEDISQFLKLKELLLNRGAELKV